MKSELKIKAIENGTVIDHITAGNGMTMMYLGIGNNVVMPDTPQSVYFSKKQAKNSSDVLYFREKLGALALCKPEEGWSSLFAQPENADLLRLLSDVDFRRAMQVIISRRMLTFTLPSLAKAAEIDDAERLGVMLQISGLFARRELMIDESPLVYYELTQGETKLHLLYAVLAFAQELTQPENYGEAVADLGAAPVEAGSGRMAWNGLLPDGTYAGYVQLVPQDDDGDAGDAGLVGVAGNDGFNVVALAGEQTGHLAEDAGNVLYQHTQGIELLSGVQLPFHSRPSFTSAGNW